MIDWRHWHNEPYLVGGIVLLGWLYAILAGPLRARLAPGAPFPRGQAAQFYTALVIFYFMHLRWDKPFCTIMFFIGLVLASGTTWALLELFMVKDSLPLPV